MLELSNGIFETYINMHAFSYPKQMLSSIARLTFLQNSVLSYFQVRKDPLDKCKISAVQVRFQDLFSSFLFFKQNNRIWQIIGAACMEILPPCISLNFWYMYQLPARYKNRHLKQSMILPIYPGKIPQTSPNPQKERIPS